MTALATDLISVVIADDHPVMRAGLRMLLDAENDMQVVAESGTVEETLETLRLYEPDVVLLDLYMPGGPCLRCIPMMLEASPRTSVVVLTMQTSPGFVREALRLGATAYVTKQAADGDLVHAVRGAAHDEPYVQPTLGAQLAVTPLEQTQTDELTARETEVLRLIALGYTNAEIAGEMGRSVRTVESHRTRLQRKLDLGSRAELVRYALEHGMLEP